MYIHLFSSLSYYKSKASSKASSPHSAIQSFLFQMRLYICKHVYVGLLKFLKRLFARLSLWVT